MNADDRLDIIPEHDVVVLRDPTDVWLLKADEDGTFHQFEQWEKGRRIKAKAVYHHPSGTNFYLKNADDPYGVKTTDTDSPLDGEEVPEETDTSVHTLKAGENVWDVARAYNVPVASLIAENELEDPVHTPAGTELFIPVRKVQKDDETQITYELFETPRKMHVARPEGAKKWSFGGVRQWTDLYSTGRNYPEGFNLDIVALATVPIGNETAGYYLDSVSLGDYLTTGLPRYTNGFNHTHLEDGHTLNGTPDPKPVLVEQVVADAMQEDDRPEINLAKEEEPEKEAFIPYREHWKQSFEFLNKERKPELYMFEEDYEVRELDGRAAPKPMYRNDSVRVIGTFEKDGITYARAAVPRYWFGIPLDKLVLEDTVYNTDMDLPTRVVMRGHLDRAEKRLVMLAKAVNHYRKLTGLVKKKQ